MAVYDGTATAYFVHMILVSQKFAHEKKKKKDKKKSPSPGIEPGVAGGFVPKNLKANSVTDYTIREHIHLGKEFISVSEPIEFFPYF